MSPGAIAPGACDYWLGCKYRQQKDRHYVGNFDHRINCRTSRILVGIADRVPCYYGAVGIRALTAMMPIFNILLGIILGSTASGH